MRHIMFSVTIEHVRGTVTTWVQPSAPALGRLPPSTSIPCGSRRSSADGDIVLLHDDLLERGTDLVGWASDRTSAELLAAGIRDHDGELTDETALGLAEALELLRSRAEVIQLEVKATSDVTLAERTAAALCARADVRDLIDRVEVISFWPPASRSPLGPASGNA
jgi:hypothetical protein